MHDIPRFAHPGFSRQKASTPGSNDPGVEEKREGETMTSIDR